MTSVVLTTNSAGAAYNSFLGAPLTLSTAIKSLRELHLRGVSVRGLQNNPQALVITINYQNQLREQTSVCTPTTNNIRGVFVQCPDVDVNGNGSVAYPIRQLLATNPVAPVDVDRLNITVRDAATGAYALFTSLTLFCEAV